MHSISIIYFIDQIITRSIDGTEIHQSKLKSMKLPMVTIQLPFYNEKYVALRVIQAVCNLDYPKDKMQIQDEMIQMTIHAD